MYRILTMPFDKKSGTFDDSILNDFVLNKEIIACRAEFFQSDGQVCWTVFIECDPLAGKVAEQANNGLNEAGRMLLQRLREWRKERSEKDGVPLFIIATNAQLVECAKRQPASIEALRSIRGFGKGKTERYGREIVEMIRKFNERT